MSRWSAKAEQTGKTAQMLQLSRLFPHQPFYISITVLKLTQKHQCSCTGDPYVYSFLSLLFYHLQWGVTSVPQLQMHREKSGFGCKRCLSSRDGSDVQPQVPLDEGLKPGGLLG